MHSASGESGELEDYRRAGSGRNDGDFDIQLSIDGDSLAGEPSFIRVPCGVLDLETISLISIEALSWLRFRELGFEFDPVLGWWSICSLGACFDGRDAGNRRRARVFRVGARAASLRAKTTE